MKRTMTFTPSNERAPRVRLLQRWIDSLDPIFDIGEDALDHFHKMVNPNCQCGTLRSATLFNQEYLCYRIMDQNEDKAKHQPDVCLIKVGNHYRLETGLILVIQARA